MGEPSITVLLHSYLMPTAADSSIADKIVEAARKYCGNEIAFRIEFQSIITCAS